MPIDNRTDNFDLPLPHPDNMLADDVDRLIESFETIDAEVAPLESPEFTGTPAAPTAAGGTNTTQLATTAFVTGAVAPKAPLASPALTGTPTAPTASGGTNTTQLATTAFVTAAVAPKAPLASPALTGTPTAPTATAGNNTTQLATTAFVRAEVANLVAAAPGALDTLDELAAALGDDPNFATTMTNQLATKAPLASPALTGNPTAPTPAKGDNDTSIATTAFVRGEGKQYGSISILSSSSTIAASQVGGLFLLTGSTTYNTNLPAPIAALNGKTLTFSCSNPSTLTLTSPGGVVIGAIYPLADAAVFAITAGDKVEMTCDGSNWYVTSWRQRNNVELFDPVLLGDPTAPTQTTGNNSNRIATTAFVDAAVAPKAPIDNPTFTGVPYANSYRFGASVSAGSGMPFDGGLRCFVDGAYNYGIGMNASTGGLEYHADQAEGLGNHRWYSGSWDNPQLRMELTGGNLNVTGQFTSSSILNATLTGNPTAPTPAKGDNDTSIATTAFVTAAAADQAPLPTNTNRQSIAITTGSLVSSGTFYYWVVGKLVFFSCALNIPFEATGEGVICTIPSGIRPASDTYCPIYAGRSAGEGAMPVALRFFASGGNVQLIVIANPHNAGTDLTGTGFWVLP